MIRLYNTDLTAAEFITDASDITVTGAVNGDCTLIFKVPRVNSAAEVNMYAELDGRKYRIYSVSLDADTVTVKGMLEGIYAAKTLFVPAIDDMINVKPSAVLNKIFSGSGFTVLTSVDGMTTLDDMGVRINYFATEKQTAYEAVESIIECVGFGEMYFDGMNIALVEHIGTAHDTALTFAHNLSEISREVDTSQMITKLYPYGHDGLDITSVNSGKTYILSDNADEYGIIEGYMDFSDVTDASRLLDMAKYKFSADNADRIDVPAETLTVECAADSEYIPREGDSFIFVSEDDTIEGRKRIVEYRYTPLDNSMMLTFGHVRRDLYYYIKGFKRYSADYDRVSDRSGSLLTQFLSGDISTDRNTVTSENGYFTIEQDLMTVKNSGMVRLLLGNRDGVFGFSVYDTAGAEVISLDDDGGATFSGTVSTAKDALVGDTLSLGNVSERPSIKFYGMNGVLLATIYAYTDSDGVYAVNIATEKKSGDAGRVYVNGSEVVTRANIAEILAEVE